MSKSNPPVLIVNDGTLGGLVSCWAEGVVRATLAGSETPAAPVAWFPTDTHPGLAKRRECVKKQAELCGLAEWSDRQLIRLEIPTHGSGLPDSILAGTRSNLALLNACLEAASRGISRVTWPIHIGPNAEQHLDALGAIGDRALLLSQLAFIDAPGATRAARPIRIETPYADFSDAQLIDLALDMDAPLGACWWCLNEQPDPCGQCSQCMRWREALLAVDPAQALSIDSLQQQRTPAPV